MKFLDKTKTPEVEIELTLNEVQRLIKAETGRDLIFDSPVSTELLNTRIKLIRFPNPMGFAIAANEAIKKDTMICGYGGIVSKANDPHDDIAYLETTVLPDGSSYQYQANKFGDFGALMMHLPDEAFLETCGIDKKDYAAIQRENTEKMFSREDEKLYVFAKRDIQAGELIGFSYGLLYWVQRMITPALFKNKTLEPLDLSKLVPFLGVAALFNKSTGKATMRHQSKCNETLTALSMNFFPENLLTDNALSQSHFIFLSLSVHAAVSLADAKKVFKIYNESKKLISFFPAINVLGCAPPPGSEIVNNKTVLKKRAH